MVVPETARLIASRKPVSLVSRRLLIWSLVPSHHNTGVLSHGHAWSSVPEPAWDSKVGSVPEPGLSATSPLPGPASQATTDQQTGGAPHLHMGLALAAVIRLLPRASQRWACGAVRNERRPRAQRRVRKRPTWTRHCLLIESRTRHSDTSCTCEAVLERAAVPRRGNGRQGACKGGAHMSPKRQSSVGPACG